MATTSRQSLTVSEWSKIFSENVTENYTNSLTFMKQLTVIAVSTITFMKSAFSDDNYTTELFGGVKLRILKKTCRDERAQFISSSLQQAFDAFNKKYLDQLVLCFYEGDSDIDNLVEYHIFKYEYKSGTVVLNLQSKTRDSENSSIVTFDHVKESTHRLIRSLIVILNSAQILLTHDYSISIRLYYNADAPEDYQAPGFTRADESLDHLEPTLHETIKMGSVETSFHRLSTQCFVKDCMKASNEANASENAPVLSEDARFTSSVEKSGAGAEFNCPCNKYDAFQTAGASEILTCQYCKFHQHAVCFGILDEFVEEVVNHCCTNCYDADPTRIPTDTLFVSLSAKKRESLAIFRRALNYCLEVPAIGARDLMKKFDISQKSATNLMRILFSNGILDKEPRTVVNRQIVIPDKLKKTINDYFQSKQDKLVDRILSQTFNSQESVSDPISEVLSPLEQIQLQNASNIATFVNKPVEFHASDNEVLKEYREAMIVTNDDLPVIKKVGKRTMNREKTKFSSKRSKVTP